RCALVCAAIIALFSAFSFRLIYLQVVKHDEYAGLAAEKHVYKQVIYAERGTILDANNEVLAHNIPVETVVADATHLNNRQAVVDLVSNELGVPIEQLAEKLSSERRFIEHNRVGQEIVPYRGQERAPRDGYQVHLTVDLSLQNIVENEIEAAMKEYTPQKATIILMRPQTGEILAIANRPNFDLNLRSEAKPEEMKNRAIIDMMEPGSTFKIVAAAAALNERKVRPDSTIFCENGLWNFGGSALHDHRAFSYLSVRDILIRSSNIGAAKLALNVGEQKFYEYIRRFGFGERTGVELPGEINGLIRPPQSWSKISITRIPMGHEIGVTPLQMTVAMAAIANGGKLLTPRIV